MGLDTRVPDDLMDGALFADRIQQIFGDLSASVFEALTSTRRDASFCVNALRGNSVPTATALRDAVALDGVPMYRMARTDPGLQDAHLRGEIYIQNPSSYFAASLLRVAAGMEVLDLAAAPGGKTFVMAAAMHNTGRIAAVEPVAGRFHRMRANLERLGVTNVAFYQRDGRGVGRSVGERFDRVLVDAPCSSEARMRWDEPSTYRHWRIRKIKEAQRKQKALIRSGYDALRPGGRLLYCTCSFAPEENEAVVSHLVSRTDAHLIEVQQAPTDCIRGLTGWGNRTFVADIERTLRIVPGPLWDGFFVALIGKPERDESLSATRAGQ